MVEDARRRGVERWAVRHAEEQSKSRHTKHTGDKAPSIVAGFLERIFVRSKINNDTQPRFLVGWSLGHKDADVITLMEDVSVSYNGSWKCCPEGRSVANERELQSALAKMKDQGGVMCTEGMVSSTTTHFYILGKFPASM